MSKITVKSSVKNGTTKLTLNSGLSDQASVTLTGVALSPTEALALLGSKENARILSVRGRKNKEGTSATVFGGEMNPADVERLLREDLGINDTLPLPTPKNSTSAGVESVAAAS